MKKQVFLLVFSLLITNSIFSQIVNTFPLDDSVGIGTNTLRVRLLDSQRDYLCRWMARLVGFRDLEQPVATLICRIAVALD
jgi:hypothetical protein